MGDVDLTVKMGSLTFKNPVIPGSSEIAFDAKSVKKCIDHGVGGIVTKSWVNFPEGVTRPFPYQVFYRKFPGYDISWITYVHQNTIPTDVGLKKEIPEMIRLCRKAEIPIVGSLQLTERIEGWVEYSKKFEEAGYDGLELNLSCPQYEFDKEKIATGVTRVGEDIELGMEIIKAVKETVSIPAWAKLSPIVHPAQLYAVRWAKSKPDGISAHNAPLGMLIDVDAEEPFGSCWVSGYLPGKAFVPESIARIVLIREVLPEMPISGIGGMFDSFDALQYLLVGCQTVQICSGVYIRGYKAFDEIIDGVKAWMEKKGYTTTDQFIGKAFKKVGKPRPDYAPTPFPDLKDIPYKPVVDMNKCRPKECNVCQEVCFYDCFEVDMKKGELKQDYEGKCYACGCCVGLCPEEAIKLVDKKTGEVIWDNRGLAKTLRPYVTYV